MKKRLIVWDFDSTLTLEHTSEHVGSGVSKQNAGKENNEAKRNNMRHPHITQIILRKFQQLGDENVIASFHQGTERADSRTEIDGATYIRNYQKNGIPGYNWDTTHIIADCADDDIRDNYGKNFQIAAHVEAFNQRNPNDKIDLSKPEDRERVILIDDDPNNIEKAIKLLNLPFDNAIKVNGGFDNQDHFLKLIEKCGLTSNDLIKETAEIMSSTAPAMRREQAYIARLINKIQALEKISYKTKNSMVSSQTLYLPHGPNVSTSAGDTKSIAEAENTSIKTSNNIDHNSPEHSCFLYALQCLKDAKLPENSTKAPHQSQKNNFSA